MQTRGSASRRQSDESDEELLNSGLYLDFPERNKGRGEASNNSSNSSSNNNTNTTNNNSTNNNNEGGGFGGAFRRFIKKAPSRTKSQSSSSSMEEKAAQTTTNMSTTTTNNNNKMSPNNVSATATSKEATAAKPIRRRGSHMMPEGGGKMPTSAELMAQKEQQMQQQQGGVNSDAPSPSTTQTATATTTATTTVKTTKPRRRRGSHAMPEGGGAGGGGQKLPTSAELMAQKQQQQQQQQRQQQQQQQQATAAASPNETSSTVPQTMKMGGKKSGGRRRGSHAMPDMMGGGQKLPTSAELMAQKQQAAASAAAAGGGGSGDGGEPMEMETEEPIVTATTTTTTTIKAKPGRRRGSHAMPEGGQMKMPTSAELIAQKEQQQAALAAAQASCVPQDADKTVAMKMMGSLSGSSTPRSTSSMPQGQMQHLSVVSSSNNNGPTPMDTTSDSSSAPTPSSSTKSGGGRPRARRRGSVVKTMVDSGPKNVDGDGEHVATASTEVVSSSSPVIIAQSEGLDTSMKLRGSMMFIDGADDANQEASLPQTRPSVEDQEMGNKRPMLKQPMSSKLTGESSRNLGTRGKKKDRGRKAIRAVAADLDYVHKVIPKSSDAKELIYDAIKPNILFRACSIEELYDLVDAFEPQYVPMGSVVIQEGDEGDHFYVMEKGGVDVFEKDVHKCSLYSGVAFGEIALLYSCPRTATVQAKYDCKLWVINRRAFRGITAQHKKRRLELKSDFLKKVKIHDKVLGDILKPSEINSMALATKVQNISMKRGHDQLSPSKRVHSSGRKPCYRLMSVPPHALRQPT